MRLQREWAEKTDQRVKLVVEDWKAGFIAGHINQVVASRMEADQTPEIHILLEVRLMNYQCEYLKLFNILPHIGEGQLLTRKKVPSLSGVFSISVRNICTQILV